MAVRAWRTHSFSFAKYAGPPNSLEADRPATPVEALHAALREQLRENVRSGGSIEPGLEHGLDTSDPSATDHAVLGYVASLRGNRSQRPTGNAAGTPEDSSTSADGSRRTEGILGRSVSFYPMPTPLPRKRPARRSASLRSVAMASTLVLSKLTLGNGSPDVSAYIATAVPTEDYRVITMLLRASDTASRRRHHRVTRATGTSPSSSEDSLRWATVRHLIALGDRASVTAVDLHRTLREPAVSAAAVSRNAAWRRAIVLYSLAISKSQGRDVTAIMRRATCFARLKAWDQAAVDCSAALRVDNGSTEARLLRAQSLARCGNTRAARADLTLILKNDPACEPARLGRAEVELLDGDHDAAISELGRLIDDSPAAWQPRLLRARLLRGATSGVTALTTAAIEDYSIAIVAGHCPDVACCRELGDVLVRCVTAASQRGPQYREGRERTAMASAVVQLLSRIMAHLVRTHPGMYAARLIGLAVSGSSSTSGASMSGSVGSDVRNSTKPKRCVRSDDDRSCLDFVVGIHRIENLASPASTSRFADTRSIAQSAEAIRARTVAAPDVVKKGIGYAMQMARMQALEASVVGMLGALLTQRGRVLALAHVLEIAMPFGHPRYISAPARASKSKPKPRRKHRLRTAKLGTGISSAPLDGSINSGVNRQEASAAVDGRAGRRERNQLEDAGPRKPRQAVLRETKSIAPPRHSAYCMSGWIAFACADLDAAAAFCPAMRLMVVYRAEALVLGAKSIVAADPDAPLRTVRELAKLCQLRGRGTRKHTHHRVPLRLETRTSAEEHAAAAECERLLRRAEDSLDNAITRDGMCGQALELRARLRSGRLAWLEAASDLDAALQCSAAGALNRLTLCRALVSVHRLGEAPRAVESLQHYVVNHPGAPRIALAAWGAMRAIGQHAKAAGCLAKAIHVSPGFAWGRLAYGSALCRQGKYRVALTQLLACTTMLCSTGAPSGMDALRGIALRALGRFGNAVAVLRSVVNRGRASVEAMCALAEALHAEGQSCHARTLLSSAMGVGDAAAVAMDSRRVARLRSRGAVEDLRHPRDFHAGRHTVSSRAAALDVGHTVDVDCPRLAGGRVEFAGTGVVCENNGATAGASARKPLDQDCAERRLEVSRDLLRVADCARVVLGELKSLPHYDKCIRREPGDAAAHCGRGVARAAAALRLMGNSSRQRGRSVHADPYKADDDRCDEAKIGIPCGSIGELRGVAQAGHRMQSRWMAWSATDANMSMVSSDSDAFRWASAGRHEHGLSDAHAGVVDVDEGGDAAAAVWWAAAEGDLASSIACHPTVRAYLARGDLMLLAGRMDCAAADYRRARLIHPSCARAATSESAVEATAGSAEAAEAGAKLAVMVAREASEPAAAACFNLALMLHRQGKLFRAIVQYSAVVAHGKEQALIARARRNRAAALLIVGKPVEAEADLQGRGFSSVAAVCGQSQAALATGRIQEALVCADQAVCQTPTSAAALNQRAVVQVAAALSARQSIENPESWPPHPQTHWVDAHARSSTRVWASTERKLPGDASSHDATRLIALNDSSPAASLTRAKRDLCKALHVCPGGQHGSKSALLKANLALVLVLGGQPRVALRALGLPSAIHDLSVVTAQRVATALVSSERDVCCQPTWRATRVECEAQSVAAVTAALSVWCVARPSETAKTIEDLLSSSILWAAAAAGGYGRYQQHLIRPAVDIKSALALGVDLAALRVSDCRGQASPSAEAVETTSHWLSPLGPPETCSPALVSVGARHISFDVEHARLSELVPGSDGSDAGAMLRIARLLMMRGIARHAMQPRSERFAAEDLTTSMQLLPTWQARVALATIALQSGRADVAVRQLTAARAAVPHSTTVQANLAAALALSDRSPAAQRSEAAGLLEAVALWQGVCDGDVDAGTARACRENCARVLRRQGDLEGAAAELSRAIKCSPDSEALYDLRSAVHAAQGSVKNALIDLATVIAIRDTHEAERAQLQRSTPHLRVEAH